MADEGGRSAGSRFLKKKAVPESLSRKSSQFVSESQQQQLAPRLCSSQTAALSRLADLESRSRKQAGHLLKSTSDLRFSPAPSTPSSPSAASPAPPSTAGVADPFQLSPLLSDEQSPKGRRFLKSYRASGVKASQPAVLRCGIGPRPSDAYGAESSAGTEMKQVAGINLESDEEDMKKLLRAPPNSTNSCLTPARPKYYKTADEVLS